jgi:hypothetical protein
MSEHLLWYVEFGSKPQRNPLAFGPFQSEAAAENCLRLLKYDNPQGDFSRHRIVCRPGLPQSQEGDPG